MDRSSYVYILASEPYGTLYIGVSSDLVKRIWQHREGVVEGFTKKHGVKRLVWYEIHAEIVQAIMREKQIKKWNRDWKVNLIQKMNPDWRDLYDEITKWRVTWIPAFAGMTFQGCRPPQMKTGRCFCKRPVLSSKQ